MLRVEDWIKPLPAGLYCAPADLYIDPLRGVDRAVITHGHGDHARPGNGKVLATKETLGVMTARIGSSAAGEMQALPYGEPLELGEITLTLQPAGHILGSAQVVLEYRGSRVVVSGDYKRRRDPTCPAFVPVPCDVFVTEATFALPVFRHPPDAGEIAKLLDTQRLFPERTLLVGVYSLGKAQRVAMLLREAGWNGPLWYHGALAKMNDLYREAGLDLGDMRHVLEATKEELQGAVVLAPPGSAQEPWTRRLADPITAMASGWMGVRALARQRGAELPLVISDHADWDELTETLRDVGAPEVWVTHGNEEALIHYAALNGIKARALALVGYEEGE
jgi:putative mRNA 3-end processing factor